MGDVSWMVSKSRDTGTCGVLSIYGIAVQISTTGGVNIKTACGMTCVNQDIVGEYSSFAEALGVAIDDEGAKASAL